MSGGLYELFWRSGLLNIGAIARRELGAWVVSPVSWVVGALFVLAVSFFGYLQTVLGQRLASMDQIFSLVIFLMIFGVPLYTKRLLAEERRTGTIELLLASPVRNWEVAVGKWLGGCVFYAAAVGSTLVYVGLMSYYLYRSAATITVHPFGASLDLPALDYGLILGGYVGLLLAGGMMVSIGLLASSLTMNQSVAALVGIGALLLLWYVGEAAFWLRPPLGAILDAAAAANRFQGFSRGQIAVRDLVYFFTLTVTALFLTSRSLAYRRRR